MTTLATTQDHTQLDLITPRANLYASDQGWTLIVALAGADQEQTEVQAEGQHLSVSAPLLASSRRYLRELSFPKDTRWGDLSARWEGDLLYIDLQREQPLKRRVEIQRA
jgi:HSP20 family molecular chaperone IbpA